MMGARRQLTQRFNRDPTLSEIASESGFPEPRVVELLDLLEIPVSLDTPVGNGESRSRSDRGHEERPAGRRAGAQLPSHRARPRLAVPDPAHAVRARASLRPQWRGAEDARGRGGDPRSHARARTANRSVRARGATPPRAVSQAPPRDGLTRGRRRREPLMAAATAYAADGSAMDVITKIGPVWWRAKSR